MKKRNFWFVFLFVIIIISNFFYIIFISDKNSDLTLEFRKKTHFPKITLTNFLKSNIQNDFDHVFSDRFFERNFLIKLYKQYNYHLYELSIPNKKDFTLVKTGEDAYYFKKGNGQLTNFPYFSKDSLFKSVDTFLKGYNKLVEKHKDLNFYFLKPWSLNEMEYFDQDNNLKSYGVEATKYFEENLNKKVLFTTNKINKYEDFLEYYYKTDKHWNELGAYQGYKELVKLMNEKPLEYQKKDYIKDLTFCGDLGRKSGCFMSLDKYLYLDFDLKPYKTFVNGVEKKYGKESLYLDEERDKYFDIYVYGEFRGNDEKEVIFDTNNLEKENALIFTDSYAIPIKRLIAQHFNKTYCVDLRLYKDFNFDEYVKKYNIKNIIHVAFSGSIFANESFIFKDN